MAKKKRPWARVAKAAKTRLRARIATVANKMLQAYVVMAAKKAPRARIAKPVDKTLQARVARAAKRTPRENLVCCVWWTTTSADVSVPRIAGFPLITRPARLDQLVGYATYHPEVVGSNPARETTGWREMFIRAARPAIDL